jgi:emfourin
MAAVPDRIEVVRHGGFAGIERRGTLDVAACSEDERGAALAALDDLRRAAAAASGPSRPDAFTYTVAVTAADGREELTVPEHAVDDAVRPFLDRVLGGA